MLIIKNGDVIEPLQLYKNLSIKKRVGNDDYSLSFNLIGKDQSYDLVEEEKIIEYQDQEYRIIQLNEHPFGTSKVKNILGQHVYFDLIDSRKYDIIGGTKSIDELMTFALDDTGFTFEIVGSFELKNVFNFGDANSLKLIQRISEIWAVEIELQKKHLVIKKKIGKSSDFQFRFGHNIKTINKSINTSNLTTIIKGFGRGFVVTYRSPLADTYGERHAEPIRDDSCTSEDEMLDRLKLAINDNINLSITLTFAELKKAGYPFEEVNVGDEIYLIHETLGIETIVRVMEYLEFPEENQESQVTLANYKPKLTDELTILNGEIQEVSKQTETHKSEIRQTNEKIELEVTKVINDLSGEIEENRSLISQTANEINLRVDSTNTNVDGLSTRLNNVELKITNDAIVSTVRSSTNYLNDLNTKTNVTDHNSLVTRVSNAELKIRPEEIVSTVTSSNTYKNDLNAKVNTSTFTSTVQQLSDSIALKVSSTDFNGNNIVSKINLEVGSATIEASKINLLGIVEVANILDIGGSFLSTTSKMIRFRGSTGGVVVGSQANSNNLYLAAGLGPVRIEGNTSFGVWANNQRLDNLTSQFASLSHTHSEYASSSHSHSDYLMKRNNHDVRFEFNSGRTGMWIYEGATFRGSILF